MIDGWDKGPRDRSQRAGSIDKAMDWIFRLGPKVVIEARDLVSGLDGDPGKGVVYADLAIGEGPNAHRMPLGPVLYGAIAPETACAPASVLTVEDALRHEEQRGRAAAAYILSELNKAGL